MLAAVHSRYCGHPRDLKFVSVIAGVRNSEVRKKKYPNFTFKAFPMTHYCDAALFLLQFNFLDLSLLTLIYENTTSGKWLMLNVRQVV